MKRKNISDQHCSEWFVWCLYGSFSAML